MAKKRISFKRKTIQLLSAIIYNAYIQGFAHGTIFREDTKGICVPGLNCYSCPGAIGSCPLGSLQDAAGNMHNKFPYYILGFLLLLGLLFGRVICGFLCPFGLVQEWLYKIPSGKIKKNKFTRRLSNLKYVILVFFVVLIPILYSFPAFCKYICPAGALGAGIPLVVLNPSIRSAAGQLFIWKVLLLIVILISTIFIYRSFCRFLCPLGAVYSLFHNVSLAGIQIDEKKCNSCSRCIIHCKMDVCKAGDWECIQCGECIDKCNANAIIWKSIIRKKAEDK